MIINKYTIINIINEGNYGKVYKVQHNNIFYALKEELENNNILLNEANIYKELRFIKNIGKMKDYFIINDKSYLVLNLYDKNLLEIKNIYYNNSNYINFDIVLYTNLQGLGQYYLQPIFSYYQSVYLLVPCLKT